jgi:hypothetical protein
MALQIGMVTADCADPKGLAAFWAAALDTTISGDYGEFVMLAPPPAGGPVLGFQRVPEPRAGKNRLHLDLGAGGRPGRRGRAAGRARGDRARRARRRRRGSGVDHADGPGGERVLRGRALTAARVRGGGMPTTAAWFSAA